MTGHLGRYVRYIRATKHVPLPTIRFDDDWGPIGPRIRDEMVKAGLVSETKYGMKLTAKGWSLTEEGMEGGLSTETEWRNQPSAAVGMRLPIYLLGGEDGRTPVPTDDLLAYGRQLASDKRIVAKDELPGGVEVSTVFIGMDKRSPLAMGQGEPIVFETMVFEVEFARVADVYSTWEEAAEGHRLIVRLLRARPPGE